MKYFAPQPGSGAIFADVVDEFVTHRKRISRPSGKSFADTLDRLKDQHGLEPLGKLNVGIWRKFALDRIGDGAQIPSTLPLLSAFVRAIWPRPVTIHVFVGSRVPSL